MKEAVQISVRVVQLGRAAVLLGMKLLHFKGPPYHDASQKATISSHNSALYSWEGTVRV
jgi:hypothetical protein